MMSDNMERVLDLAAEVSGIKREKLSARTAVDQDMRISGDDVIAFAEALAKEFGPKVWHWPWQRFALLDEGLSLLFPLMLVRQLLTWPFRGRFGFPSPYERLELGHIAAVIDNGEWFVP